MANQSDLFSRRDFSLTMSIEIKEDFIAVVTPERAEEASRRVNM